jgi:hypothetical protein
MRWLIAGLTLGLAAIACSADFSPRDDGQVKEDKNTTPEDTSQNTTKPDDSNVLPWPEAAPPPDTIGDSCSPGQAGMCDDNKNLTCVNGKCESCPENKVDCNRQSEDGCECLGACNGDKCVGGH